MSYTNKAGSGQDCVPGPDFTRTQYYRSTLIKLPLHHKILIFTAFLCPMYILQH